MAIPKATGGSPGQAPKADTRQAPKDAPKKPQDNTAAKQAPKETKSAVNNTFGKVPANGNAKQPDNAAKSSNAKQASDAAKTPGTDATQSDGPSKEATPQPKAGSATQPATDAKAPPAPADDKASAPVAVKTPINIPGAPGKRNLVTENPAPSNPAGDTNAPAGNAKAPPAAEPKTAQTADAAPASPADPRVQGVLDAQLPDGKTVKEKIDKEATDYIVKAAQDHYNAQKDKGEPFDAVSTWYQNSAAKIIAEKGIPEAKVPAERIKDVFDLDKINQNIAAAAKDPAFAQWMTEQQANSVQNTIDKNPDITRLVQPYLQEGENYVNALRRMQSDYMRSQDFADAVAKANTAEDGRNLVTEGMKTLASFGLDEKETLGVNNTLAENIRSKYTPEAPRPVIDPNTNKAIQTEDGNSLAVLNDGTNLAIGPDGKTVADEQGNAYVYYQDGSYKQDANGKYIQYDARAKAIYAEYDGTKYMLGPDRKGRYDAQGRPLAIDSGAPVALGKDGKAVADAAGNKLVFDPVSGKAVTDPATGNAVVIDPATKAIVQTDAGGKVIAGDNGDPYAVDQTTGKFVQDAQGRYVQISKDNIAPGILPGYVVDAGSNKVVVNSATGKPMVDPSSGKTVILDPKTNAPQLVPLDTNGAPKQTTDGKGIILDESGNTVVPNDGKGPNWLVDANGNYAQDANGNTIGINSELGLAATADQNGFIKNASGLVPLWDIKANAPMTSKDGYVVAADNDGNLLMANADGTTVIETKTSLPYLFDPKTMVAAVNPDTGRSVLLDKSGLPVEYNADDGYKYLINPETGITVKTAGGNAVTTDDNGVPYAVRQDGSAVTNTDTGNTVVYGVDGQPAKEEGTGYNIEITSSGKPHVIDPKTNTPMAERDPKTGGYQLFNKDGTDAVNPDTGNKVQMVPDSGVKVEIDPKTNKPVTDAGGNPLVMGTDYKALKTPDGNAVVADLKTGLPVTADANGKLALDPASKLPIAVNAETGMLLTDPATKAAVVADPTSRQLVQVDANGKIVTDPVTAMPVALNEKTGAQVTGPKGALAVNDPRTGLPVYYDQQTKLFTVVDPESGKAVTDPKSGAKTVVDTASGMTFNVLPDAKGNHIIIDENGKPAKDAEGNQPWFDSKTGTVVTVNGKGEVVDPSTGKKPEALDPKELVYTTPILMMGPPAIAVMGGVDTGAGVGNPDDWPQPSTSNTVRPDRPWEAINYKMSPQERADFIGMWQVEYGLYPEFSYERYLKDAQELKRRNPALQNIPDEEIAAVRGYTKSPWWRTANQAMYTGEAYLLEQRIPYIKAVKSGLTHLREAGLVFEGQTIRQLNLEPDQFANMFREGGVFDNEQFMSTTVKKGGLMKRMNTELKVNHITGVDVRTVSRFPKDGEIIGEPGRYRVSNVKPASEKGGFRNWLFGRNVNRATLTEIPRSEGLLGGNPEFGASVASKATGNWAGIGKALSKAGIAADAIFGGVQVVTGALDIAEGVKNKDNYGIAAGSLDVGSGVLALGATAAWLAGGAAAAAAAPLTGAAAVVGMVALIVDILKHKDDHTNFANSLGDQFGPFGILKDGWREKAAQAYYDSQGEPDPAPIAHGNNP